jgi:hypothetical protein
MELFYFPSSLIPVERRDWVEDYGREKIVVEEAIIAESYSEVLLESLLLG